MAPTCVTSAPTSLLWEDDGIRLGRIDHGTLGHNDTVYAQLYPNAQRKANENFTMLWTDLTTGNHLAAGSYNDQGHIIPNGFNVTTGIISTTGVVTHLLDGGSMWAWSNGGNHIQMQVYNAHRQLVKDTFPLNTQTQGACYSIALETLDSGYVVGSWLHSYNGNRTVYFAVLNPQGDKILNDTVIPGFTEDYFNSPYIVPLDADSFLCLLEDVRDLGFGNVNNAIQGISFYINGTVRNPLFRIDNDTVNKQYTPKGVKLPGGEVAVVWRSLEKVYGRIYDADLVPMTGELTMTREDCSDIFFLDVNVMESYGGFVFGWDGKSSGDIYHTVFAQFAYANGTLLGDSFQVKIKDNPNTNQEHPSITVFDNDPSLVCIALSNVKSGSSHNVYLLRFHLIVPTSAPTLGPTRDPTRVPTYMPTLLSQNPTLTPSRTPTSYPSQIPTYTPSHNPSATPTKMPSFTPSLPPTQIPTVLPTLTPTKTPSRAPTSYPSQIPTYTPSHNPSATPTKAPSRMPSHGPTEVPTLSPLVDVGKNDIHKVKCLLGKNLDTCIISTWILYGTFPVLVCGLCVVGCWVWYGVSACRKRQQTKQQVAMTKVMQG